MVNGEYNHTSGLSYMLKRAPPSTSIWKVKSAQCAKASSFIEDRSIRESMINQVDFMLKDVPVASQQVTEVSNSRKRPRENQEISEECFQQNVASLDPIITDNSNGNIDWYNNMIGFWYLVIQQINEEM